MLLRAQNTTLLSKVRRRFFQIFWPFQKTQTLKAWICSNLLFFSFIHLVFFVQNFALENAQIYQVIEAAMVSSQVIALSTSKNSCKNCVKLDRKQMGKTCTYKVLKTTGAPVYGPETVFIIKTFHTCLQGLVSLFKFQVGSTPLPWEYRMAAKFKKMA